MFIKVMVMYKEGRDPVLTLLNVNKIIDIQEVVPNTSIKNWFNCFIDVEGEEVSYRVVETMEELLLKLASLGVYAA